MASCCYRYLSRREVCPIARPVVGHQFIACYEDAMTAAAEHKVIDHSPQYAGTPFLTICIIPAKKPEDITVTASVPFAIDVLSKQSALLATPDIDPEIELRIRHSVIRVRCVMADMEAGDIAHTDNWGRLGDLVDAILKPTQQPDPQQGSLA